MIGIRDTAIADGVLNLLSMTLPQPLCKTRLHDL